VFSALAEGFVLGISTGTVCFVTCAPIYLPWLMSEKKSLWRSLGKLMEISAGRFIAYILFGALAGYFGGKLEPVSRSLFTGISYILLSIFLLLNVFRTHREGKKCKVPKWAVMSRSAFLLGLFTGVNFCPSFLIALSSAVNMGGMLSGMQVFLGFFFGTTLFLLPLALSGYLTFLKEIKAGARIASVLIAAWFIWQGTDNLIHYYHQYRHNKDTYLLDMEKAPLRPVIISAPGDSLAVYALRDSLSAFYPAKPEVIFTDSLDAAHLPMYHKQQLVIVTEQVLKDDYTNRFLKNRHQLILKDPQSIQNVMPLLRSRIFRIKKGEKLDFRV